MQIDKNIRSKVAVALKRNLHSRITDAEIDDLVEDAIVKFINDEGIPEEVKADENKAIGWLCTTAIYLSLNYWRKAKRNTSLDGLFEKGRDFQTNENFEDEFIIAETLRVSLDRLSDDEKKLVIMRMQEYSFQEISEEMGVKKNTLEQRHGRIIAKLSAFAKRDMKEPKQIKPIFLPTPDTRHPTPDTRHPKPDTRNPKHETRNRIRDVEDFLKYFHFACQFLGEKRHYT